MNKAPGVLIFIWLLLMNLIGFAQNISGKWYGKLSQGPGGYSQLYDFDLNLKQNKGSIRGESSSHISDIMNVRIGLTGTMMDNKIQLQEKDLLISKLPEDYFFCIKNITLTYRKEGNREYLQGDWNGVGEDDGKLCTPGNIILSRTKADLQLFLANGGFNNPIPESLIPDLPLAAFTKDFNNTTVKNINEIEVNHINLTIRLSDYKNIDNDTVSVYLNRNPLAKNVWISKRPVQIDFKLNTNSALNELLLFAENLGEIPPNTSQLLLIDGNKKHTIKIESDKQKTAAIYLRYNPVKSK